MVVIDDYDLTHSITGVGITVAIAPGITAAIDRFVIAWAKASPSQRGLARVMLATVPSSPGLPARPRDVRLVAPRLVVEVTEPPPSTQLPLQASRQMAVPAGHVYPDAMSAADRRFASWLLIVFGPLFVLGGFLAAFTDVGALCVFAGLAMLASGLLLRTPTHHWIAFGIGIGLFGSLTLGLYVDLRG